MIKDNGDGTLTVSAPCDFDITQPASQERCKQMHEDFIRWRAEHGLVNQDEIDDNPRIEYPEIEYGVSKHQGQSLDGYLKENFTPDERAQIDANAKKLIEEEKGRRIMSNIMESVRGLHNAGLVMDEKLKEFERLCEDEDARNV